MGGRAPLSTSLRVATAATAIALIALAVAPPGAARTAPLRADATVASSLAEQAGLQPPGVRALQRRLAALGYLSSTIDDKTERYADVARISLDAVKTFAEDVRNGRQLRGQRA